MNIFRLREQLDTIVGPHSKHTIEDQGCSWATPLKNCAVVFFCAVLIRHHIFWVIGHSWEFQKVKEKNRRNFSEGKGKRNDWKFVTSGSGWTQERTTTIHISLRINIAHWLPPWKIVSSDNKHIFIKYFNTVSKTRKIKCMKKNEKNTVNTYYPKKTLDSSETLNQFYRSIIILENLVTIANPHTNRRPTLRCIKICLRLHDATWRHYLSMAYCRNFVSAQGAFYPSCENFGQASPCQKVPKKFC